MVVLDAALHARVTVMVDVATHVAEIVVVPAEEAVPMDVLDALLDAPVVEVLVLVDATIPAPYHAESRVVRHVLLHA